MKSTTNRRGRQKSVMKKSPALYITMLLIWTALSVFLWLNFIPNIVNVPFLAGRKISGAMGIGARILLGFNGLFISYFWLNGVKDFLYVVWYYSFRGRLYKRYHEVIDVDVSRVKDKILWCTVPVTTLTGRALPAV